MTFAQRMKPSESGAVVQTFLAIRRERSVVETNGCSDLYVVTAWMTCEYVSSKATRDEGRTDSPQEQHGKHRLVDHLLHEGGEYLGTKGVGHRKADGDS